MKRSDYQEKLEKNLLLLPRGRWYSIQGRPDYKKFVETVQSFIDSGWPFEFDEHYTRIKVNGAFSDRMISLALLDWQEVNPLPQGYRREYIAKGYVEQAVIKGHTHTITHESASYRIYKNDQLIAIENERN